jgi:secondary thiamine-phosphate synthase enzyme
MAWQELKMVKTVEIKLNTKRDGDIIDITSSAQDAVKKSGITSGTVTAFVSGSTAGITTLEYEPGLRKDLPQLLEKLIPSKAVYHHDETWHDGNGFSHLRSAIIGTDITVPFVDGELLLGQWQQIVFCEFDNRPRARNVVFQIIGE